MISGPLSYRVLRETGPRSPSSRSVPLGSRDAHDIFEKDPLSRRAKDVVMVEVYNFFVAGTLKSISQSVNLEVLVL